MGEPYSRVVTSSTTGMQNSSAPPAITGANANPDASPLEPE